MVCGLDPSQRTSWACAYLDWATGTIASPLGRGRRRRVAPLSLGSCSRLGASGVFEMGGLRVDLFPRVLGSDGGRLTPSGSFFEVACGGHGHGHGHDHEHGHEEGKGCSFVSLLVWKRKEAAEISFSGVYPFFFLFASGGLKEKETNKLTKRTRERERARARTRPRTRHEEGKGCSFVSLEEEGVCGDFFLGGVPLLLSLCLQGVERERN
jgi:hypothetical protein